jgi:hypothetical protein
MGNKIEYKFQTTDRKYKKIEQNCKSVLQILILQGMREVALVEAAVRSIVL